MSIHITTYDSLPIRLSHSQQMPDFRKYFTNSTPIIASGAITPNGVQPLMCSLQYLLCPVKEGYNRASCAVLIDTERSFLSARCITFRYLLLIAPEYRFIEDMTLRHILE